MAEIILKGHKVARGRAEGEALVSHMPIAFMGGINPETGLVIERGHDLEGVNVSGKILVFPFEKGSTVGSFKLYEMVRCKTAPRAIINLRAGPILAAGAIISKIPMVDKLDGNPLELIKTGDYLDVDADQGVVKIKGRPS